MSLLNIGQASKLLNVTEDCLRKWEKQGKIHPYKTPGKHRRYEEESLKQLISANMKTYADFYNCLNSAILIGTELNFDRISELNNILNYIQTKYINCQLLPPK